MKFPNLFDLLLKGKTGACLPVVELVLLIARIIALIFAERNAVMIVKVYVAVAQMGVLLAAQEDVEKGV